MQDNDKMIALNDLVGEFSNLNHNEQISEIEKKIKTLIGLFNSFNSDKKLSLVSDNTLTNSSDLTQIFNLLCCLEEEIAKLLLEKFNIE